MKLHLSIIAALFLATLWPATLLAQAAKAPAASATRKPAAKPPAKLAPSAAKAVEEVTPIDDDPNITLSEGDLEVAKKVYLGRIPCELGAAVQITPAKREGFFMVRIKFSSYLMHPVESRTGAVRLEDPKRGAMWLQLGNKSMLMSQKLGLRLADECMSTEQVTFADQMKKNPPRNLLEPEAPAK